jgi:DNA-binding MarR family transcriptional regulator
MGPKLDTPPPHELDAVVHLRLALRRFQATSDEVTARHRLTPRQYDLLAVLHGGDESRRTPTLIAHDLQLGRNTLTELVTRAEDAGLVRRARHSHDRRSKRIVATAEGTRRYLGAVAELRPERTRLLGFLREAAARAEGLPPDRRSSSRTSQIIPAGDVAGRRDS